MRPQDLHRLPLREGEPVTLVDDRERRYFIKRLQPGRVFQTHRIGLLPHDRLLGRPPGVRLRTDRGIDVVCLRPSLEDLILNLRRQTQIIYPKDLGTLLLRGNLFPGAQVLESGIGSGASAMLFRRFLGPEGRLISYEQRPSFARLAEDNLAEVKRFYGDSGAEHRIVIRDVYEGIAERDLDAVLLDVPEPQRAADHAAEALRPGGTLLCWVPTTLQVYDTVRHLQVRREWAQIETVENLQRPWEVSDRTIRPAHRMVAHTGFLISARRVVHGDDPV